MLRVRVVGTSFGWGDSVIIFCEERSVRNISDELKSYFGAGQFPPQTLYSYRDYLPNYSLLDMFALPFFLLCGLLPQNSPKSGEMDE